MSSEKRENCGLFGIYLFGGLEAGESGLPSAILAEEDGRRRTPAEAEAAWTSYFGLYAMQHRGQESAGVVVSDGENLESRKGMGLVSEVLRGGDLDRLAGNAALGHVRYSTAGSSRIQNIQPLVLSYSGGVIAVAHNGTLVNARQLRDEYEARGSIFQTSTDSEIIVHLLADPRYATRPDSLGHCLRLIEGAYSFLFLTSDALVGARDPRGFRPLVLGTLGWGREKGLAGMQPRGYVLASESCALAQVGAELVREIEPGEIVRIDRHGLTAHRFVKRAELPRQAHCIFEHVYFARPDSILFGQSGQGARLALGRALARQHPVEADMVMPVPDSGNAAAEGYAMESGIPYLSGFIRNHYVGRSFIMPSEEMRRTTVKLKLSVIAETVRGKRVVVVDDSIVRGTTSANRIRVLREAGARAVHVRVSCPPVRHPCYYGVDFPTRTELVADGRTIEQICEIIGADSLGFLSVEGMREAVRGGSEDYCTACYTGEYPVQPADEMDKYSMERPGLRSEATLSRLGGCG